MQGIHFLYPFFAVSNENTYAPLQFVFTAFLIHSGQTLTETFWWGRFPSFIFSLISILLLVKILVRYFGGTHNKLAVIYAALIISFSYEFMIYSVQMESYAIGIMAVLYLIHIHLSFLAERKYQHKLKSALFGISCGILLCMQYQLLFFILASFLSIIFEIIRNKALKKVVIINGVILLVCFLTFFFPIYILFLSKYTNHVAEHLMSGDKLRYFFPAYQYQGIIDYCKYFFSFWILNSVSVFRYMTMSFPEHSVIEILLVLINGILLVLGFRKLFKETNAHYQSYLIFLACSSIIWLALVSKGSLAFTPDRHSLILLPFFCINIFFGIQLLLSQQFILLRKYISFLIPIVFLSFFLLTYKGFFMGRKEPFISQEFKRAIQKHKIDLMVARQEIFYLMPEMYSCPIFYYSKDLSRQAWIFKPTNNVPHLQTIALIGPSSTNGVEPPPMQLPKTVAEYYQQSEMVDLDVNYHLIDAFQFKSKTDEVNDQFTRWIDVEIKIFQNTKPQ